MALIANISIHALREEGDCGRTTRSIIAPNFYPRPPRGGRRKFDPSNKLEEKFRSTPCARRATARAERAPCLLIHFYPRPPRGGRLSCCGVSEQPLLISIHALREEGDRDFALAVVTTSQFLSTPSARRATHSSGPQPSPWLISIHALREEGDHPGYNIGELLGNFYPRPPRGGRPRTDTRDATTIAFLSTPSARRATTELKVRRGGQCHFYPRPPRGGRQQAAPVVSSADKFLSTPSARRATSGPTSPTSPDSISIHALREEGDRATAQTAMEVTEFLSTPSARRATVELPPTTLVMRIFLSTPSARRATAKTETKSLFSYKLYNILHEFRRALIYNGSKNYPNHAK